MPDFDGSKRNAAREGQLHEPLVSRNRRYDNEHGHRDRKRESYRVYGAYAFHSSHVRRSPFISSGERRCRQAIPGTGQTANGMRPSPEVVPEVDTRRFATSDGRDFATIDEGETAGSVWASPFPLPLGAFFGMPARLWLSAFDEPLAHPPFVLRNASLAASGNHQHHDRRTQQHGRSDHDPSHPPAPPSPKYRLGPA